jgi:capsular polysaccharide biosynthesis protein|tara:strand:- start:1890 stop:2174 length:285 start_codon:yes stop_codon:yes gene_type:complete
MTTSYIREAQKELKAQKALAREAEALALSEANAKAAKEEAENNERIARKLARIAGNPVPEPEPQPEPEAEEAVEEKPKVKAAPKKKKPAKKKSS